MHQVQYKSSFVLQHWKMHHSDPLSSILLLWSNEENLDQVINSCGLSFKLCFAVLRQIVAAARLAAAVTMQCVRDELTPGTGCNLGQVVMQQYCRS